MSDALYAPTSEPPDAYVAGIKGIATVRIPAGREIGLVQLRKLLQDAGLRDLEREATCRIERHRTSAKLNARGLSSGLSRLEGAFRWVAFDFTTAYGLHPGRALWLLLALWFTCALFYLSSINGPAPREVGGIYRVSVKDAIDESPSSDPIHPRLIDGIRAERVQGTWPETARTAAYFSILSATNLGFQQFTLGDWIHRVARQDAVLQAVGLPHIVSGIQTVLGLFLLAVWVLTYFGRPFQ